ncbi:competence protein CoiA family protein [Rhodococcus phenolicus]|uniref:competence protein CoiA family protein n=1 Tax=Rhodococcus phenolicus TaxID=263849 RepID=UPI000A40FAF1|nr:competence protein CoiA family protein [Rhodococcus phenolicus]
MDRAFDLTREQHVLAIDAQRHDGYVCPCCCGRVHLRDGMSKIAHFAHKKDEGTPLCEEYHPGSNRYGHARDPMLDGYSPLLLRLHSDRNRWSLFIDLESLTLEEAERTVPSVLAFDGLTLHRAGTAPRKIRAASLWPGSGRSSVLVQPSRESSIIQTSGKWPNGIRPDRWRTQLAGLSPKGTLFVPHHGGAFRRYDWATAVRWGDTVVAVGPARAMPPNTLDITTLDSTATAENTWHAWLVRLPKSFNSAARRWLAGFGVARIEQRTTRTRLATPAVEYGPGGVPRYLLGEPIVVVPSPQAHVLAAESHATFNAKSLRRSRTTPPVPACFVSAIESGPLRIRTDTTGDAFQTEIITESVTAEPTSVPLWSLRFNDQLLPPYSTQQVPNQADTLRIGTTVPALRFSVTAVAGDNTIESSWDAEASAAAEWIMQRLSDSVEIEVRAGNLGFVRLHTHQSATPVSRSRLMRGVESQDRSTRSRMAWREAYKLSVDHADEPTDPHWEIRRRRGPSDPTNPLHKV